jgi:uncharacterized membrane protein
MRSLPLVVWIIIGVIVLFAVVSNSYAASVEIKKVCHDVVVKGKKVQKCKMVKIHQRFKGTAIPTKK